MLQVAVAVPADVPASKELRVAWFPHLASGGDARAGEKDEEEDGKKVVLEAAGALLLHGRASSKALSSDG